MKDTIWLSQIESLRFSLDDRHSAFLRFEVSIQSCINY
jgi:hypothetical protein